MGHLTKKIYESKYFNFGLRTLTGAILLVASVGKIISHAQVVHAVASLKVLPYFLIQPVDQMLPWLELVLGICFVLGVFPRIVAAIGLPLFSAFIVINVFNLQNGLANPCSSCFGNLMVLRSRDALLIDVFLVLAALRTISLEEHFMSLEGLWTRKRHSA